jgi:hypothetical protein
MIWTAIAAGLALCGWLLTHARLRQAVDTRDGAIAQLAELQTQVASLRHDLNGILSPALLTADRLLDHSDPSMRRAGEVIVRTVDRATARLAATKLEHGRATLTEG